MAEVQRKIEQPAVLETPTGTRPDTLQVDAGVKCALCGAPRSRLIRKAVSHVARTATCLFHCDACGGYWSDITTR